MVKLTVPLIEKKCLQQQSLKSLTREMDRNHLKKITHLFMDEHNIDEIDDISICKNLRVVYLQRNSIEKIENLDFATSLTHLYLQHNEISKIVNLKNLVNLRKLFLGYNSITIIDGLENLTNLSELHIEKQKLAVGERLRFEPRTIRTLSKCLMHLNVSGNKMTSLSDVNYFKKLTTLEARDNLISDVEDLTETICSLRLLENLFLQGNPVTKIFRYRENLIANSYSLVILDDKRISDNSREFLQRFKIEKINQSRRKIEIPLSEDITNSLNLPPAFKRSVSRAMSQNVNPSFLLPGVSIVGGSQSYIFPQWKTSPSLNVIKDNHIIPRQLWKNKANKQKIMPSDMPEKTVAITRYY